HVLPIGGKRVYEFARFQTFTSVELTARNEAYVALLHDLLPAVYGILELPCADIGSLGVRMPMEFADGTCFELYPDNHEFFVVYHHLPFYAFPQVDPWDMFIVAK